MLHPHRSPQLLPTTHCCCCCSSHPSATRCPPTPSPTRPPARLLFPPFRHAVPPHTFTHPPARPLQAPERFRRWFPLNKRNAEFNAFITVLGFAWLVGPSELKEVRREAPTMPRRAGGCGGWLRGS